MDITGQIAPDKMPDLKTAFHSLTFLHVQAALLFYTTKPSIPFTTVTN